MSPTTITAQDFAHLIAMPLRWGDADMLGHINNVQYFRYAEEARVTWFEQLFPDLAGAWDVEGMILADMQCRFIRQLHWPQALQVGVRAKRLGRSSITHEYGYFIQGEAEPVATGSSVVVWFDYAAQRSIPLPPARRQAIIDFERMPPQM